MVIAYLNEEDDADETAEWVRQAGRKAVLAAGELDRPEQCRALIDRAVGELGGIEG